MEFQQANSHANLQDGTLWMSCFQTSAVPNPVTDRKNNPLLKALLTNKCMFTAQNSAQNSEVYIPTNASLQPQQGPCNPPTQPIKEHYASASYGVQYHRIQEAFYQHVNGAPSKPYPTAALPSCEQMVCSRTFVPPTAHNQQTGNIQNQRQNVTQQIFFPVVTFYNGAMSQSCTTTSSSNHQLLCNSSMSLQNQQYLNQLNSSPHCGGGANCSVNSSSYNCCSVPDSVQKETNTQPLKVTADPPQKPYGYHDEIARIVKDLKNSYPADSKARQQVHTSSPPTGRQSVSEDKMMSNQTVQPMKLHFARRSNSNPTTNYEMTMKKMGGQQITQIRNEGRNTTKKHIISKANSFGSDASQSMQQPPQRVVTSSSTGANNQNDSPARSSPGCASTRAVAVVQPLSQKRYQFPNNYMELLEKCTATDKSLIHSEKVISPAVAKKAEHPKGLKTHMQSSNQKWPNIKHSPASNDVSVVSDSDSARPQDMSQEQVPGEQCILSVPQKSVTSEVPEIQNCEKDKGETPTDPKACVTDLSSVQTTPWTAAKLANLIQDLEKTQVELQDAKVTSLTDELKTRFWKKKNTLDQIISNVYSMTYAANVCKEHVTSDTVILSQVKVNSLKQLQNYHVLHDDEVYSEPPYISSWLNVNEQVDDIDKEFGFSSALDYRLHTCSQSDKVREATFEMPNKNLSQTELVPADSGEEDQDSTVKSTSTCSDEKGSTDPYYSFEIKVLPPEEAKRIFEQIHKASTQSMDIDSQPETVTEHSVEHQRPNNEEVTGSDSEHRHKEVSSIETFCCLEWWMGTIIGSESPVKCNCRKKLSGKVCTEKNPDEEDTMVENDSKLRVIKLDRKLYCDVKGDTREKAEENGCNRKMTWSCSALSDNLIVDLTDDEKPHCQPEKSIDDTSSNILVVRESEELNEDLSSSWSEIPSHIPDSGSVIAVPEEACVQEPLVFSSDPVSQMSDPEEACEQVPPTSTSDNMAQSQRSTTADLSMSFRLCDEAVGKKKRKKQRSHKNTFPFPKISRDSEPVKHQHNKVSADATDEPTHANVNAELMLFGSKHQWENISFGGRTSGDVSPPRTLSVNLNKPLRHKSSAATPEYSAKQMVHDAWRRSYLPIKINHKGKLKLIMPASHPESEVIFNKSVHNTTSEISIDKRKTEHGPRLKKRQRLAELLEKKMTEDVVPLKQPDRQRSGHENGSSSNIPLKKSVSFQLVQHHG